MDGFGCPTRIKGSFYQADLPEWDVIMGFNFMVFAPSAHPLD